MFQQFFTVCNSVYNAREYCWTRRHSWDINRKWRICCPTNRIFIDKFPLFDALIDMEIKKEKIRGTYGLFPTVDVPLELVTFPACRRTTFPFLRRCIKGCRPRNLIYIQCWFYYVYYRHFRILTALLRFLRGSRSWLYIHKDVYIMSASFCQLSLSHHWLGRYPICYRRQLDGNAGKQLSLQICSIEWL